MRAPSLWLPWLLPALLPAQQPITFETLLGEMIDLDRLTRLPEPDYRTVQWSSTDRRSKAPDQPGWFANADGFGQEPIPGFDKVLKEPGSDGVGEYLVCDVDGPGAIVRGWSAGMDGVLRVWLDGNDKPLFEGKGYDFFARRSSRLVDRFAALAADVRAQLQQQDADYLPIPFAERLRVSWTGRIRDLHFYQLQVRRYVAGTRVTSFTGDHPTLVAALATMLPAAAGWTDERTEFALPPGQAWEHVRTAPSPAALRELLLTITADDLPRALRGVLVRIACDDSPRPQVEAPVGDFFASAPGLTPFASQALAVAADGTLTSRWVMPYRNKWRIELVNHAGIPVRGRLQHRHAPRAGGFDDKSLYFHALWRADHQLSAQAAKAPIDLPYLTAIGQGRFVGCACLLVNPPMAPSWRSNWWGEGDEKIFVDGGLSALGTGSEDYFNYSWSHWQYFSHPYCGQPLSSGPGNCGYATNYRLQILDDLPFAQSLSMAMELWSHKPVSPLSYARISYFYARPGVVTDHRAIQPSDLVVPSLPPWTNADFPVAPDSLTWMPGVVAEGYRAGAGKVEPREPTRWTRSGAVLSWLAPPGARLELPFAVAKDGSYRLRLCCQQRPDAPAVQVEFDGARLRQGEADSFPLTCVHGERYEDLLFDDLALAKGAHTIALVCPLGGTVGVDLVGYEMRDPPPAPMPGAVDAELWDVVKKSDGLDVELQDLGAGWSAGHQRWVRATRVGDFVTFRLAGKTPGRYRVTLRLTQSWDYGIVRVDWNGVVAARDVDLWCGQERRLGVRELDLGERDLMQPAELTFTVTGHAAANVAPHCFFGIDCAVLTAR